MCVFFVSLEEIEAVDAMVSKEGLRDEWSCIGRTAQSDCSSNLVCADDFQKFGECARGSGKYRRWLVATKPTLRPKRGLTLGPDRDSGVEFLPSTAKQRHESGRRPFKVQ